MRGDRAQLASVSSPATSAPQAPEARSMALGALSPALAIDGPVRHPRAGLRNAFSAHAVRVLRPKVP